ncbi:MAG: PRC and DUF2382 domain-containing protein [Streptosporangiaceae bacterium]|nr:PRC and DUF2382 domain-containing protein [Streptosporangiaceae bacterium]
MTTPQQWDNLIGATAIDADGEKVGKVGQVYLDEATGQPEWVTVSTGLFGTRESFAPLYNAQPGGGELRLAVTKQQIKDAPNVGGDDRLTDSDVDALYRHYAGYLEPAGAHARTEVASGTETAGAQGRDVSGPTTDDAMTRSEERLHVGTENVAAGRARLRKYVVTENVTQTVPVSHEEVRIEREPITEANRDAALSGPDISEEEHEVTLHAERPVVEKEAVPVERVRLSTETVTEQHEVSEQVRKEQIDEPDVDPDMRRGDH